MDHAAGASRECGAQERPSALFLVTRELGQRSPHRGDTPPAVLLF